MAYYTERYTERFKDAPWYNKSKDEPILVVGAGGIGSNLLYYLTKTILSDRIVVVDPDTVEPHNIGTQFFRAGDIGKKKVDAIRETLSLFGVTSFSITPLLKRMNHEDILPITIVGVDNMKTRREVFENWKQQEGREILIDGRLSANFYQVFTVLKGREEEYEKTLFPDELVPDDKCTFKQTAYFAGLIGARMVHILVNYLMNKYSGEDICNVPFFVSEAGELFLIKTGNNHEDL